MYLHRKMKVVCLDEKEKVGGRRKEEEGWELFKTRTHTSDSGGNEGFAGGCVGRKIRNRRIWP